MASNRFLGLQNKEKPTRHFSKKQEDRVCEVLGMKATPNSGATAFKKGDIYDDHAIVECKTLTKPQQSHSIKKEWFDKNQEEAFAMGRRFSVLCFDFGDGNDYVAMNLRDFKEFYDAWKEKNGEEE